MSSILDSKNLIRTIKRRAFVPSSQETFTNDDFLEMATEEINIGLMDQLMNARGDYLVQKVDVTLQTGVFEYPIPDRAVANKLRDVSIIDQNGNVVYELAQISLEELSEFDGPYTLQSRNAFYMQNNNIVLTTQTLAPNYKLRMYFYIRPNKLVINERAATVSSIVDNGTTSDVSFSTIPTFFTSDIKYDVIGTKSPNKIKLFDLVPVSVNSNTKTISFNNSDIKSDAGSYIFEVGDFVNKAEESIVPNIPTELHPIVAQRVAVACLEAMGDEQNKQSAERKLAAMEKASLRMLSNRVEGAPKKIRNRHGTLNYGVGQRRTNRSW